MVHQNDQPVMHEHIDGWLEAAHSDVRVPFMLDTGTLRRSIICRQYANMLCVDTGCAIVQLEQPVDGLLADRTTTLQFTETVTLRDVNVNLSKGVTQHVSELVLHLLPGSTTMLCPVLLCRETQARIGPACAFELGFINNDTMFPRSDTKSVDVIDALLRKNGQSAPFNLGTSSAPVSNGTGTDIVVTSNDSKSDSEMLAREVVAHTAHTSSLTISTDTVSIEAEHIGTGTHRACGSMSSSPSPFPIDTPDELSMDTPVMNIISVDTSDSATDKLQSPDIYGYSPPNDVCLATRAVTRLCTIGPNTELRGNNLSIVTGAYAEHAIGQNKEPAYTPVLATALTRRTLGIGTDAMVVVAEHAVGAR